MGLETALAYAQNGVVNGLYRALWGKSEEYWLPIGYLGDIKKRYGFNWLEFVGRYEMGNLHDSTIRDSEYDHRENRRIMLERQRIGITRDMAGNVWEIRKAREEVGLDTLHTLANQVRRNRWKEISNSKK